MKLDLALLSRKYLPYELHKTLEVANTYLQYSYLNLRGRIFTHLYYGKNNKKLYPSLIILGSTTKCNLNCVICDRANTLPIDLELENVRKIKKVLENACDINLTGYGEPLLNKNLKPIIEYIYSINNRTNLISIVTNGTLLNEEFGALVNGRINNITISLNAATEDTYKRDMKNAKLSNVIGKIKNFMSTLDEDSRSRILLSFVAHSQNYSEIPNFLDLAHEIGISKVRIGQFAIFRKEDIHLSLLNVKDEYNKYIDLAIKKAIAHNIVLYERKFHSYVNHNYNKILCFFPYSQLILNPDGSIDGPCCCGEFCYGNVFEEDFESIWFGKGYKKIRKHKHLPTCNPCRDFASFESLEAHFCHGFLINNRTLIEEKINSHSTQFQNPGVANQCQAPT